jgi:hypothetical protein
MGLDGNAYGAFFEGFRKFAIQPIAQGRASATHVEDIHGLFATVFSIFYGWPG